MNGRPVRHRKLERPLVWAFLSVWGVYAFFAAGWIGNPMGTSILDLTVSIVDEGTIAIDPYAGNSVDAAERNGHAYSGMPPGASVVAIPVYALARPALDAMPESWNRRAAEMTASATDRAPTPRRAELLVLSLLFVVLVVAPAAALSVLLLVLIWRRVWGAAVDPRTVALAAALFAFGSLHFYYGSNVEHRSISTTLLLGAFLLVLVERDRANPRGTRLLGAGALLGAAVTVTYETALPAALIAAYAAVLLRRRAALAIGAGMALPLALLAWYHAAAFGGPLATGYAFRAVPASAPPLFLRDPSLALDPAALAGSLVGTGHGLFFYSPVLLVALIPLFARRVRRDVVFGWTITAALLAFHHVSGYRGLAGEYGFRQMLCALPFAAIALPAGVQTLSARAPRLLRLVAALGLVVVGKGVLWGLEARGMALTEPLGRWGVSSYVLRQANDHLRHLGPVLTTVLTLAGLGLVAWASRTAWRRWAAPPAAVVTRIPAPAPVPAAEATHIGVDAG